MSDIRYLLSIKELLDGCSQAEELREQAYAKLDRERRRKLDAMKTGRKYAECLGAGLLLQLGLQESGIRMADTGGCDFRWNAVENHGISWDTQQEPIHSLTVSQVISRLNNPIEAEYTYGKKGKPYFRGLPFYFSLSHSGDYVFCVFSNQEIGADIQYRKPNFSERIVRRFFTEKEQEVWKNSSDEATRKQLFYKLWTRKEAYGKFTGEGIVAGLLLDVLDDMELDDSAQIVSRDDGNETDRNSSGVCWEDYEITEDYQISICKRPGEKE